MIELKIPSITGYERIVMACSAAYAKISGMSPEKIEDLKTAVSEACMNAIEHGNMNIESAKVYIKLSDKGDGLEIIVQDEGKGLKKMPRDPSIERKLREWEPARGFGVFLIKQLSDEVEFNYGNEGGHAVRLFFKIEERRGD